jgi:hypothetical protein
MTDAATSITVDELRARLRRAQAEIGSEGHFSVTFYQQEGGGCSIMHWTRPEGSPVEACEEVGHGTLAECLAALERYVEARRRV